MTISVLITTLNEEKNLPRCLESLVLYHDVFTEIIVIDSGSGDQTTQIAESYDIPALFFQWNGQYPKKRQWILDNVETKNDWVFFLDADECVTEDFVYDLRRIDDSYAGYFVKGRYIYHDKPMQYGLYNNKLALFNRTKVEFSVIDDLMISAMGEIEGHYQPVLKASCSHEKIGQIRASLHHHAYEELTAWHERHERYAMWESYMIKNDLYPRDPLVVRQILKKIFVAYHFERV